MEVLPAEEQVVFTADLGSGTKTYLEYEDGVYKTRWNNGDQIFVLATNDAEGTWWYDTANIIEGVGTSTAKFAAGSHVKGENYYAFYGAAYYNSEGVFSPILQEYQHGPHYYNEEGTAEWGNNIDGFSFPMYAESTSTNFAFKNLCSILKVDLVGTDYIDNIVFTPNDTSIPVAGITDMIFTDNGPELTFRNDSTSIYRVCFYVRQTLNETTPVSCYISIPSQTYYGGFTLTINSNKGSMDVNVPGDETFERSQIRSLPTITYVNQEVNTWGLVGDQTNWDNDIVMTAVDQYQVLENVYLEAGSGFKFRANRNWEVNLGAVYGYESVNPNSVIELAYDGANISMTETGNYNIILDVENKLASFEKIQTEQPEYVECYSYDEVAALPDDTMVKVTGYVFVPYGRGFIMNIGDYYGNSILVYQGTDQSLYVPVMGNQISLLAKKVTYNNLPELKDIQYVEVIDNSQRDFGYNQYYNLYDPEVFSSIYIDRYEYVKYAGLLQQSGNYYNVTVEGVENRVGSIQYPLQDLTEYLDKKVSVEGWFIGFAGANGQYLQTVLRSITLCDDEASTEDVVPGEDIVITKSSLKIR